MPNNAAMPRMRRAEMGMPLPMTVWHPRRISTAEDRCGRPSCVMVRTPSSSHVWTRLGRSLADALRTVQALADRGIGLQALDVDLDTSTASGRLMLNMLLMLAEWERGLLRERTRKGVARARAAGRRPGPKPKLDEEKTAAVRAAVAGGQPVAAVTRSFGVSRPTIYKALDTTKAVQP